jgi:hypothetical protein
MSGTSKLRTVRQLAMPSAGVMPGRSPAAIFGANPQENIKHSPSALCQGRAARPLPAVCRWAPSKRGQGEVATGVVVLALALAKSPRSLLVDPVRLTQATESNSGSKVPNLSRNVLGEGNGIEGLESIVITRFYGVDYDEANLWILYLLHDA